MIHGHCDPRFQRVKDVFVHSFEDRLALGASVAVTVDGRPVVDLWGGFADGHKTRPWTRDTLVNVFSTTKGLTAMVAHRLVDQGLLDLDAPVARYWPEFAQADKGSIPVAELLDHQAGLPAVRAMLPNEALYDWSAMTSALAAQEPWWRPGTRHGYHAVTYGWLVGEVIRRASGRTVGTIFREELAGPLGLDIHIGFGPEHDERVASLRAGPRPEGPTLFEARARANREFSLLRRLDQMAGYEIQSRTAADSGDSTSAYFVNVTKVLSGGSGDYYDPLRPAFLAPGELKVEEGWIEFEEGPPREETRHSWSYIRVYSLPHDSVTRWIDGVVAETRKQADAASKK